MRSEDIASLGAAAALSCSLVACNFGADGNGKGAALASASQDGGGTDDGTTDDTGVGTGIPMPESGGDATGAGSEDGIGTLTTPTSTDDGNDSDATDDTTGAGEGSGEEDTGPVDMCANPPFFKQIVTAGDDGVVFSQPMASYTDTNLPGETYFASGVEDEGIAEFPWDAPCDDEYFLWARVWDDVGGAALNNDPDSYYVIMDDGGETFWRYGCQTNPILPTPSWYWVRVQESITCIDIDQISYPIDAGGHVAYFRNREDGSHDDGDPPGRIAAITRVLITNDPNYVPSDTE